MTLTYHCIVRGDKCWLPIDSYKPLFQANIGYYKYDRLFHTPCWPRLGILSYTDNSVVVSRLIHKSEDRCMQNLDRDLKIEYVN